MLLRRRTPPLVRAADPCVTKLLEPDGPHFVWPVSDALRFRLAYFED